MGSKTDWDTMRHAAETLAQFGVPHEARVLSAHRTPEETTKYAAAAEGRGIEVLIAAAGGAAHLAGVVAAHTVLPVLGVPMETASLKGLDSLLSTVQMPAGIPVGTLAIGEAGSHERRAAGDRHHGDAPSGTARKTTGIPRAAGEERSRPDVALVGLICSEAWTTGSMDAARRARIPGSESRHRQQDRDAAGDRGRVVRLDPEQARFRRGALLPPRWECRAPRPRRPAAGPRAAPSTGHCRAPRPRPSGPRSPLFAAPPCMPSRRKVRCAESSSANPAKNPHRTPRRGARARSIASICATCVFYVAQERDGLTIQSSGQRALPDRAVRHSLQPGGTSAACGPLERTIAAHRTRVALSRVGS